MEGCGHRATRTGRRFTPTWILRGGVGLLPVIAQIAFWVPALCGQAAPAAQSVVIRAGRLFDAESGRLTDHPVIVVSGNRIASVGSGNVPLPANARVIDLGDATVLPGLIDVHTHLTTDAGNAGYESLGISSPRAALIGVKNARLTLLAGFTTVRNVGAEGYADVALRDAIDAGDVIGPRMQVSGPPLGITGGHCDSNLLAPEFHYSAEGAADGVDAVIHKVREVVKYGADVIPTLPCRRTSWLHPISGPCFRRPTPRRITSDWGRVDHV